MPQELIKILFLTVTGILLAFIISIPVFVWRFVKKRPLLGERTKLESPHLLYYGIAFFGITSIAAFRENSPYSGVALLIATFLFIIALIAYKKGWRV